MIAGTGSGFSWLGRSSLLRDVTGKKGYAIIGGKALSRISSVVSRQDIISHILTAKKQVAVSNQRDISALLILIIFSSKSKKNWFISSFP